MRIVHLIAAAAALVPTIASAAETVTYSYDAKGRLTQVARSGSVNNGVVAAYAFDKADNRTNVTVSGSPFSSPAAPLVVVPLMGLSVIPIPGP
jgi:YD repeat-containing protein